MSTWGSSELELNLDHSERRRELGAPELAGNGRPSSGTLFGAGWGECQGEYIILVAAGPTWLVQAARAVWRCRRRPPTCGPRAREWRLSTSSRDPTRPPAPSRSPRCPPCADPSWGIPPGVAPSPFFWASRGPEGDGGSGWSWGWGRSSRAKAPAASCHALPIARARFHRRARSLSPAHPEHRQRRLSLGHSCGSPLAVMQQ